MRAVVFVVRMITFSIFAAQELLLYKFVER